MYQNLVVSAGVAGARQSVHLEDWPDADISAIDESLSRKMQVVREIVSLGLRARMDAKIRVRQPLREATIVLNDERDAELVKSAFGAVREELNVVSVNLGTHDDRRNFGTTKYSPNFRSLGQRGMGRVAQDLKKAGEAGSDDDAFRAKLDALRHGKASWRGHEILREDIEVTFEPKPGVAAAADRIGSVFLDTQLDEELRDLGLLRELLNRLQTMRREMGLEYTDRVRVFLEGSERMRSLVDNHRDALASELLAVDVATTFAGARDGAEIREIDVEGEHVRLGIARAATGS
jgi:isoleucyl-tRNA synthetase